MFIDIDYAKQSLSPQLYIAKPDKEIIGRMKTAYGINQVIKLGKINELSFQLPFDLEGERNQEVDKVKYRYLIQFRLGNYEEWYRIETPAVYSNESSDYKEVYCFSLGYDLHDKNIRAYSATSYNARSVLTELLQDTGWAVDYISLEFNDTYRAFEFNSTNKLDAVYNIASTFGGVLIFNTVTRMISLFKEDEIGESKGLKIGYGHYLKGVNHEVNPDKIATRLKCFGKDGLSIQGINITGQNYIEDFSYFLLPFARDENRNVLQSSDYMSDDLCHAVLDYFALLESKKADFQGLLASKTARENDLSLKESDLFQLETELTLILDNLSVAMERGSSTSQLIQDREDKIIEIDAKKSEITTIEAEIEALDAQIRILKNTVSKENNFTAQQLQELNNFIIEKELVDENYIDENDLYQAGLKELAHINTPEAIINVNIVNFLEVIEEQLNWNKLVLGDYITIQDGKLGIDIRAKIIEMQYDYEQGDINLIIANIKDVTKAAHEKLAKMLYKSASAANLVENNKKDWNKMVYNFNSRNDRNPVKPANPILENNGTCIDHRLNSDGSADISFEWSFDGAGNAYEIDGFIVHVFSHGDNTQYIFGSTISKEQKFVASPEKRAFILYGVPANMFYSFGVQAYRTVDNDINSAGVLKSEIIQPSLAIENPYLPSENIAFAGNITGTVDGIPASNVRKSVENVERLINQMPNPYFEKDKANWSGQFQGETVPQLTEGTIVSGVGNSGGKVLELTGQHWIYSAEPIPINVNRKYKVIFKVRQTVDAVGGDSKIYAGVVTLDANYQNITGGAGTHRYCAAAGQTIAVANGWQSYEGIISGVGTTHDTFREGTVYVRPMFIVNYPNGDGTVQVDAVEFYDVTEVGEAAENFNQRNDRISTIPANPVIAGDNTALDHTINDDGSADISFEWNYTGTGDAYNIDGFVVYINSSISSTPYNFGTNPNVEQAYYVEPSKRAFIMYGVPANRYYTFGIQAYRIVDQDINNGGILKSNIIKSTLSAENPYRPASHISFSGNISGTINGQPVDTINKSSTTFIIGSEDTSSNYKQADIVIPSGTINAQDYINYAINNLPSGGGKITLLEGTYNINGSIIISSNVTFEGLGSATIIKSNGGTEIIKNKNQGGGDSRITIANLRLDADYRTNILKGIDFCKVSNCRVIGVEIIGLQGYTHENCGGVFFLNSHRNTVEQCYFLNCKGGAVYLVNSSNNSVTGNKGEGGSYSLSHLYFVMISATDSSLPSTSNIISYNLIYRCGGGVYLNNMWCLNNSITGNIIDYCKKGAISTSNADNSTIKNNVISNNSQDSSDNYEILISGSSYCSIQDNFIRSPGNYAVYITGSDYSTGTLVINNDIKNTLGIYDNGVGTILTSQNRR